jgi:hypothetical protein
MRLAIDEAGYGPGPPYVTADLDRLAAILPDPGHQGSGHQSPLAFDMGLRTMWCERLP